MPRPVRSTVAFRLNPFEIPTGGAFRCDAARGVHLLGLESAVNLNEETEGTSTNPDWLA